MARAATARTRNRSFGARPLSRSWRGTRPAADSGDHGRPQRGERTHLRIVFVRPRCRPSWVRGLGLAWSVPKSDRHAARRPWGLPREPVGSLVERVGVAIDRFRDGELDAFGVDQALFQYSRAAKELWKLRSLGDPELTANIIRERPSIDWWDRGAPRNPLDGAPTISVGRSHRVGLVESGGGLTQLLAPARGACWAGSMPSTRTLRCWTRWGRTTWPLSTRRYNVLTKCPGSDRSPPRSSSPRSVWT